jgi:hypothetical protein
MSTTATVMLSFLSVLSPPPPAYASASASASAVCTIDSIENNNIQRLSFLRGFLGSAPDAPCGIVEELESGNKNSAASSAFRSKQSKEKATTAPPSSSFDERAALEEERSRATQDFVDSMWQGLE